MVAYCTGYRRLISGDEESLLESVAYVGPISINFDASGDAFRVNNWLISCDNYSLFFLQFYESGVYNSPNCTSAD